MSALEYPFLSFGFIALTIITLVLFIRITAASRKLIIFLIAWLFLQAIIAYAGFYTITDTIPPRIAFAMAPMIIIGVLLGFTSLGDALRATSSLEHLHYFQAIRFFVESIFLYGLYKAGYLAKVLTFEGQNWDILIGLTAPIIGLFVFRKNQLPKAVATIWNVLGIGVLAWTISRAVLSAPSPYQQYGFEQPTLAIFHFPFVWLPVFVVPLMFWAHFICLKKLSR